MRTRLVTAVALLLVCSAAYANHYSDFYVIPVAAHTNGVNGTRWMTDIAIQNFQSTPLAVELALIESGEGSTDNVFPIGDSVTVPANGSVMLSDVLNGHRGLAGVAGAILIGSDRPFAVTSRTFSMTPDGNTIGQTVPPVRDFIDNTFGSTDLANAVAYVPGIVDNAKFRSNLGAVLGNGSLSSDLVVTVTLRGANGAVAGTRTITVAPGNFTHLQFNARSVLGSAPMDIGSAEFRITSGSGAVVPYASVIDNATADAVFISGVFPSNDTGPSSASASSDSIFRRLLGRVTE